MEFINILLISRTGAGPIFLKANLVDDRYLNESNKSNEVQHQNAAMCDHRELHAKARADFVLGFFADSSQNHP